MNETLEAMARALFQSWFVDFDPVRVKARGGDPVAELGISAEVAGLFPDSFEESELGRFRVGGACKLLRTCSRLILLGH
jgi:type I restriction enzyme S subunit